MIYESLSEEECYLLALMQDESGIDLAEFCLVDDTDDGFSVNDGCFRAYPFQVSWWRNKSQRQIDSASRSCGKSLSIKLRSFVFPFLFSDEEMIITAPEQNHLKPVTDNVETLYRSNRLAREVLAKGQSGITHRPFMIKMANGSKIMEKIPQRDGRGVKGSHPVWLEQDEGQDYPEAGWEEIVETVKIQNPRARHRVHGVTRGVGDTFDEKATGQDSQWKVHRLPALLRPNWTEKEKQDKIKEYGGSTEAIGYRRNVLGLSGDMNAPLFVLARLAKCTDTDELSDYNQDVYFNASIDDALLAEHNTMVDLLDFPLSHKEYERFWIGMDLGFCVDTETEILTQRGWLRYDQVLVGDRSLSINPETGHSEWQPITDLYRDTGIYRMIHMKGQTFDAMTTPHHKWLVDVDWKDGYQWKTTETLSTKDRIPLSSTVDNLPTKKTYSDEVVQIAAWMFTEGSVKGPGPAKGEGVIREEGTVRGKGVEFSQSRTANPEHMANIQLLLRETLGSPGYIRDGFLWRETDRFGGTMLYFYVGQDGMERLGLTELFLSREKDLNPDFVCALTQEQLILFQETCIKGDGWVDKHGASCLEQNSKARIKSYEMVCALAGLSVATGYSAGRSRWNARTLKSPVVIPMRTGKDSSEKTSQGLSATEDVKLRTIWCPTIKHGNWLARRNGSIYYTGNTSSPSCITVFAEYNDSKGKSLEKSKMRLLTKILLTRIAVEDQVAAMMHCMEFYRPKAFALDYTGAGMPVYEWLQKEVKGNKELKYMLDRLKNYGFSEKVIAGFDENIEIPNVADGWKEAAIRRGVIEVSTDAIRGLVDTGRMVLPFDKPLLSELQNVPRSFKLSIDQYGRSSRKVGMHTLDAMRMACLAHAQDPIETFIAAQQKDLWEAPPMLLV